MMKTAFILLVASAVLIFDNNCCVVMAAKKNNNGKNQKKAITPAPTPPPTPPPAEPVKTAAPTSPPPAPEEEKGDPNLKVPSTVTYEVIMYVLVGNGTQGDPSYCPKFGYDEPTGPVENEAVVSETGATTYEKLADLVFNEAFLALETKYVNQVGTRRDLLGNNLRGGAAAAAATADQQPVQGNHRRELDLSQSLTCNGITICSKCENANNWRRCVKNKCNGRRRRLLDIPVENLPTFQRKLAETQRGSEDSDAVNGNIDAPQRGLLQSSLSCMDSSGQKASVTVNPNEFEADRKTIEAEVPKDDAVVKIKSKYPCPVEFEIVYYRAETLHSY